MRRRIRMVFRKKRGQVRLGIGHEDADITANCRREYWFVSRAVVMYKALSNTRLERAASEVFVTIADLQWSK